jgi:hypothetical protein
MTLQWIPLDALVPHPENSNRMPPRLLVKLKAHIQRTGLYEPLVVRPINSERGVRNAECGADGDDPPAFPVPSPESSVPPLPSVSAPHSALRAPSSQYQILNGHHRAQVLRELGHTHARCDVWEVDDQEARVLLATLNRLEGRDDPSARASLVANLSAGQSPKDLAALLPEPADAVERLLKLAAPPPAPLDPGDFPALPRPMTFFLTEEQHALVSEALQECAATETRSAERGTRSKGQLLQPGPVLPSAPSSELRAPHCLSRAERLGRLALWYLEARNLR